ncbi:MAG: M14 family metallopeptidase [Saprospiraceae bacterium]|nr:M14 family metallopeptidase [Saprospiraceae bacterium]
MKHLLLVLLFPVSLHAQQTLGWYLPEVSYNPSIPTPQSWLGYPVGARHVTHDQLLGYMRALDQASERVQMVEYGRTHEERPLVCLIITAPANHQHIDFIRKNRLLLCDPSQSASLDPADAPAVVYMGYSIHGNEASGSNAALLVAYYLAAAQSPEAEAQLANTVVLLDPCFNPDGLQRFSTWVNSRRARNGSPDPAGDEFNEPWPGGRTNHYWFDLNRDWLVAQQPETPGRVALFQDWRPNVLTDHHEMGSNSTFFFQPGVPSRVNPITPARNQELTSAIGAYHARALSAKNSAFFSRENYDDYYYGKGSTYPDANGCIGILFEQASSRGSAQETENGLLTFPFTIRNQVVASLSTLQAVRDLRPELNAYLRDFYTEAARESLNDPAEAYVFGSQNTRVETRELMRMLQLHRVEVYALGETVRVESGDFLSGEAFVVPTGQAQYRMVRAMFERQIRFRDSIFYDISAWTLPDALGVPWSAVSRSSFSPRMLGNLLQMMPAIPLPDQEEAKFAYAVAADHLSLPVLIACGHRMNLRMKVTSKPLNIEAHTLKPGTVVLFTAGNEAGALRALLDSAAALGIPVQAIQQGQSMAGPDLGSNSLRPLAVPKVLLVTGKGMDAYSVGEVWHYLDTRLRMPVTLIESDRINEQVLSRYNVLILADGRPAGLASQTLRDYAGRGNTVIALGGGVRALDFLSLKPRPVTTGPTDARRPYASQEEDSRARALTGAIFKAKADLTHPLCYGLPRDTLAVFLQGNTFYEPANNPYATPLVLTGEPLLSGYVHPDQLPLAAGAAAALVYGVDAGRVICFPVSPCFRGFWRGTERLLANAIFFGSTISRQTAGRE